MWKRKFALAAALFYLSGCTVYHPFRDLPRAGAPESYRHYYDYPEGEDASSVIFEEKTESYVLKTVEFPLRLPGELTVKNPEGFRRSVEELAKSDLKTADDLKLRYTNRVDLYLPRNVRPGQKRPLIVISPILGGNMVVDHFARYYAGRGYVAAIVYRKRTFWDDERKDDVGQIEDYLRTSVIRLRQALDWLERQPEVDPSRIGAFGISYGAILHSVLAAVEPRIRFHVLAMPAGSLADVIMECPDKGVSKLVRKLREDYGWQDERIYEGLKRTVKTDPRKLAPHVDRRKIQIYAALFDRVVGAGRTFDLWRAMGKPDLKILPFGHYGGILVFPYLQTQSYWAFKRNLR